MCLHRFWVVSVTRGGLSDAAAWVKLTSLWQFRKSSILTTRQFLCLRNCCCGRVSQFSLFAGSLAYVMVHWEDGVVIAKGFLSIWASVPSHPQVRMTELLYGFILHILVQFVLPGLNRCHQMQMIISALLTPFKFLNF